MKSFKDLTMTDPFLFHEIMGEPENSKPLLEALLGKRITKMVSKSGNSLLGVYVAVTTEDGVCDVSLQMPEMKDIHSRVRATQAMLDSAAFEPGCSEDDLPNTCILMICPHDPFGLGRAMCEAGWKVGPLDLDWDDGTRTLFLNWGFTVDNAPKPVSDFLHWLNKECDASVSPYLTQLEKAVQAYKADPFMERAYNGK